MAADPLRALITDFLRSLVQANRSPHTQRAYASDLVQFAGWYQGTLADLTPADLERFLATLAHLRPATRARKHASLRAFLDWVCRQGLLTTNPMYPVPRAHVEMPAPRALRRQEVEAILAVIPRTHERDRLLFRLLLETGVRVGEALALHVEDLDLTLDDEHLTVRGKGNRQRTVLLDDRRLVIQLRAYLKHTGYQHGPLFRAAKNDQGLPLRYQTVQARWVAYCEQAGIQCTLHQLRHTHATELINGGVSLATIRKRLGHKNLQTTLRYAEQSNMTADAEIRHWRRQLKSD